MNAEAGDAVSAFYTAHPYPPPVENLDRARDEWRDPARHRADFHLLWPDRPYRANLDVLIAGCGTWQAAKHALCRPEARVTGIDVSTTSLKSTEQLKRKYNLTNLEIEHRSIEDIGGVTRRFDLIVCTGVLHHLADPEAGLRALRSVLKPGGVIYLMVYAPYGRSGIYMLQEYCRQLGVGTSLEEIDDLMSVIEVLPKNHPLMAILNASRDFHNADALADALLNPRDRAYSVPQLLEAIAANGLEFLRWYWQAPYLPQCGAISETPHASKLLERPAAQQWAAMELWRGAMTAHSLVIGRDEDEAQRTPVAFSGEHWLAYVPIRLPATLCVQERLPPGATGVLLNRSHPFPDLILPISAPEKRLFDAIDGRRTIAEIDSVTSADATRLTRTFFEKLWCHDQVTFDATTAPLDGSRPAPGGAPQPRSAGVTAARRWLLGANTP